MYIVRYSIGSFDDFTVNNIFVTKDKALAESYVIRFNDVMKMYKDFYKKFTYHRYPYMLEEPEYKDSDDDYGLLSEHIEYYDRWEELIDFNECFFEEIEVR